MRRTGSRPVPGSAPPTARALLPPQPGDWPGPGLYPPQPGSGTAGGPGSALHSPGTGLQGARALLPPKPGLCYPHIPGAGLQQARSRAVGLGSSPPPWISPPVGLLHGESPGGGEMRGSG
ncbi:unnamed protein product [Arctogadus glacialis]